MGVTVTPKHDGAERYQGHIHATGRDGRTFRKSTWLDLHTNEPIKTYEKALAVAADWAAERMPAARMGRDMVLADMLEQYLETSLASCELRGSTVAAYRSRYRCLIISDPISRMSPAEVTVGDLQDLRSRLLEDGNAPSYVSTTEQALSSAFTWMVKTGVVAGNPVRLLKPMRGAVAPRPRALTEDELDAIGEWVDGHKGSSSLWCRSFCLAVRIALFTGMRAGEICAINAATFEPAYGTIRVDGSVASIGGHAARGNTKSGRVREVTVPEELAADMRAHLMDVRAAFAGDQRAEHPEPLVTTRGRYIFGTQVSQAFSGLRDELGLSHEVTFHKLRHTHATRLVQAGASPKEVQRRLGHADVKTTLDFYFDHDPAEGRRLAGLAAETMRGHRL